MTKFLDYGVTYEDSKQPFVRRVGFPILKGQYTFDETRGIYTFSSLDQGESIHFNKKDDWKELVK